MNISYSKDWWLLAFKGLLILVMGVWALSFPIGAMEALTLYLGILMGLGGVSMLVFSSRNVGGHLKKLFWAGNLFDILMALLIVLYPFKSVEVISILFGVWFIVNGLFQLFSFNSNRKAGLKWKMPLINGVITMLLGLMICINPLAGMYSLALIFGITAACFGLFLIFTTFDWRKQELAFRKN